MNLIVDIGNTHVKLWLFDKTKNIVFTRATDLEGGLSGLLTHGVPTRGIVSTVGIPFETVAEQLLRKGIQVMNMTGTTPTPLHIDYRTPHTLGADRLAAAVGAWTTMPDSDLLVVDAGTCITYDFVSKDGRYCGGNISLGFDARFTAMHLQTKRLPLVAPSGDTPPLGYDTETAIRSGVVRGIRYEFQGYIDELRKKRPQLQTIVTGGNANLLCNEQTESVTIVNDLVARGLNSILHYNDIH